MSPLHIMSPYPEGGPGRHLKARLRTGPPLVGGILTYGLGLTGGLVRWLPGRF